MTEFAPIRNIQFSIPFKEVSFPQEMLFYRIYKEFPIPTELVITKTGVYSPQMGRVYMTGLYIIGNDAVPYSDIMRIPEFKGTSRWDELLLAEVWSNYGDDGHTEFMRWAWSWVKKDDFNRLYEAWEKKDFAIFATPERTNFEDLFNNWRLGLLDNRTS